MIETRKDKIKDYIITILLMVIAILIGIIYSKVLMDKNTDDIDSVATQTRKAIDNYFNGLEEFGFVLNDFSNNANFDYDLGKVNLFNKDYKISIKNNYNECTTTCKYMYKIFINESEVLTTSFLSNIRVGVIGNYVAVEEIYDDANKKLLLIRANDKEIVASYKYTNVLEINYNDSIYTINLKEQDCSTNKYQDTKVTYNKLNNTIDKVSTPTNELLTENNLCK